MSAASTLINWAKDQRKDDYDVIKEGMCEKVISSQEPTAKDFRRHCCNVLLSHARQQLTNKMKVNHQDIITGRENQIKALEYTNKKHQYKMLRLN